MLDPRPVRCPSTRCGATFRVEPERIGRNMYCPACGGRLTARPLALEPALVERRRELPDGASRAGAAIERLPFTVVVDNVRSLWNVGSIFRSADAFGVERLVLCGISGCPPRDAIAKTALGAERAVAWSYRERVGDALAELRDAGYELYALERTADAVAVDRCEWAGERIALVVGNEVGGVGAAALALRPRPVAIPMLGVKESLNVAVAFGIAGHAASAALAARVRRPRAAGGRIG